MHKTFFLTISFLCLIYFLNGIKPAPGDQKLNLKKVGAIPCGCNKGTIIGVSIKNRQELFTY